MVLRKLIDDVMNEQSIFLVVLNHTGQYFCCGGGSIDLLDNIIDSDGIFTGSALYGFNLIFDISHSLNKHGRDFINFFYDCLDRCD